MAHETILFQDIERLATTDDERELAKEIAESMRSNIPDETTFGAPKAGIGILFFS